MRRQKGFTLIEMLIVLVVLSILVAIAYPSYTNQVVKSRRADGIAALNHAAMVMESCRASNATYAGCESLVAATSKDGFYTIAATTTATATAYSFTATATGAQGRDAKCTTLALNSLGTKGYTGSALDADTCWGR